MDLLQIVLILYYGQLIEIFFYDFIIRNLVILTIQIFEWKILANMILGIFCIIGILWVIWSVIKTIRLSLMISSMILFGLLIIRLLIGTIEAIEKRRNYDDRHFHIELSVFISQMIIHALGALATLLLAYRVSSEK